MADEQGQQIPPPIFGLQQPSAMQATPFYGQQPNFYMSMQQQQYYPPLPPPPQHYRPPRLPEIRSTEYSDFAEGTEDKERADHELLEADKHLGGTKAKANTGKRVSQNDTLMSKIASTLLCNMSTFGVACLKKGGHKRNAAVDELISLFE